jgi:8-oxo-dGTP diphosphatase
MSLSQVQDEEFQGCNERGEPTARPLTRAELTAGALHAASHVWVWRHDNKNELEVLFQERSATKRTWPGHFDISAAGHVDFGESVLAAALRETAEELEITLKPDKLQLLFVHRQYFVDEASGVIENEFRWVYGFELNQDDTFNFSDGEVSSTRWLKRQELLKAQNGTTDIPVVPQGKAYFTTLLEALDRRSATDENH